MDNRKKVIGTITILFIIYVFFIASIYSSNKLLESEKTITKHQNELCNTICNEQYNICGEICIHKDNLLVYQKKCNKDCYNDFDYVDPNCYDHCVNDEFNHCLYGENECDKKLELCKYKC